MLSPPLPSENNQIPVRDISSHEVQYNSNIGNVHYDTIPEEVLIQKDRSGVIEGALSRFRSGVEKIYSESKERSIGRIKINEDDMSRKFSIGAVIHNDVTELSKIGGKENITRYLGEESAQILEQAAQMDCYVIREQLRTSKNKGDEEERAYKEEILKIQRKNTELERQIQQKKKLQSIDTSISRSSVKAPTKNIQYKTADTTLDIQAPFEIKENIDLSNIGVHVQTQDQTPEVQVIYEGKQRDLHRCLRKFAKKIFYLQKQVELLTQEKNKWKSEWEISDKNYRDLKIKYEEIIEILKLGEKKNNEMRIETEKYRTIAVSLEEELNRLKQFPPQEPEIQIVEKIIEKPIEIIKHIILEKIVEKPIEIIKTIEVPPIEVEKLVERIVEVPIERVVEKVINVPHEIIVEKIVEVPKIEIVEREKIVEVPRIEYVEKIVHVDRPFYVERPSPVVQETVEIRNDGAERELMFVREENRRIQIHQEEIIRELDQWKQKCMHLEDTLHIGDSNAAIYYERERGGLVEELRISRETIDDLRGRIELLYSEISTLTDQNNRKNLDMTNQIRLLEEQLYTFAPRLISTAATHYTHLPNQQSYADPPISVQQVQSQNVTSTIHYPTPSPIISPNLYVQGSSYSNLEHQPHSQTGYQLNTGYSQTQLGRAGQNQSQIQGQQQAQGKSSSAQVQTGNSQQKGIYSEQTRTNQGQVHQYSGQTATFNGQAGQSQGSNWEQVNSSTQGGQLRYQLPQTQGVPASKMQNENSRYQY